MTGPATAFARFLAAPEPVSAADLLAAWVDREAKVVLALPRPRLPDGFGAHLRRSFLAALAHGGSAEARAGRPCPWDPPCALDVFMREQLRLGGDGLPKPYVLFPRLDGGRLTVTLRVFGSALDWFAAAAEALVAGLVSVLPWPKVVPGVTLPEIVDRRLSPLLSPPPLPAGLLVLRLPAPLDMSGARPDGPEDPVARIAARMVRRVDAVARWQGLALPPEETLRLTDLAHRLTSTERHLFPGRYEAPNARAEARANPVVSGWCRVDGDVEGLEPILRLATRTHLGRHTNEGLGVIRWDGASSHG